jgi:hypothetical protein
MVGSSPHVGPRTVLTWALALYKAGVKEAGGVELDFRRYESGLGRSFAFTLTIKASEYQTVVCCGHCREDMAGPIQINLYQPGLWTADLHRGAIMNYDDPEDEA